MGMRLLSCWRQERTANESVLTFLATVKRDIDMVDECRGRGTRGYRGSRRRGTEASETVCCVKSRIKKRIDPIGVTCILQSIAFLLFFESTSCTNARVTLALHDTSLVPCTTLLLPSGRLVSTFPFTSKLGFHPLCLFLDVLDKVVHLILGPPSDTLAPISDTTGIGTVHL